MVADAAAFREDAGMDFEAEGLLDGLDGEERTAREQLLARLADDGFTLQELKDAVSEHRLALLPVDRVLGGSYTAAEVQERTGMPAALLLRIRRLAGLPDAAARIACSPTRTSRWPRRPRQFMDAGFGEEAINEMTRVLGEGMSRVAATTVAAFTEAFLEPGDSEQEVAERFATLAEQMTPALTPVLVATYKAHLRESVRRGMLSRAELQAGQIDSDQELSCASPTSSASPGWAARSSSRSSARWPASSPSSPPRRPSRRCGWSRRSATRRCS